MDWAVHLGRDVRQALRAIRRMPIVALVVIGSLGVGIGVNVTVFSWLQAFVFQPLPGVANISRIYLVEPRAEAGTYPGGSWLEFGDLRQQLPAFQDVLAFRMAPFNLGEAGRTERDVRAARLGQLLQRARSRSRRSAASSSPTRSASPARRPSS